MALSAFSIGDMREAVVFQQNQPIDNASGGQDDNWVTTATTRGKLTKIKGGKSIEAGSLQFDKGYNLECRYQSDLVINQDTRALINGQPYQIMDWELVDQKRHLFTFSLNKIDG